MYYIILGLSGLSQLSFFANTQNEIQGNPDDSKIQCLVYTFGGLQLGTSSSIRGHKEIFLDSKVVSSMLKPKSPAFSGM